MRRYSLGFILGAVFFTACASSAIKFPYKYFHISPTGAWDYPGGKLLGFTQDLDHNLSDCKPTRVDANGKLIQECVVVFYSELNALVKEYKTTKQALIDCQKQVK